VKMIENDFLQLLINLFGLSQDDIALSLNCLWFEFRVREDIGKYVDGGRDIGIEGFGVVYGVLTLRSILALTLASRSIQTYRCVGIEVTTHILDFQLQLLLCSVAGTL
jgi:hypothetical protein